ncbi:ABC transporter permease [Candidatus Peregrinibacteria bacterium]|nr:ABC transporter permease [Candidatus Peregrinibacteria bacterium]
MREKLFTKKNLRILKEIAVSDFKVRYQNSILGYVWTLFKPLLLFAVLYVVFSVFMRFPVENYQLYLLLGVIIWNFFAEATVIALRSFETKQSLITKIYFPRIIIVLSSTLTSFMTFVLNMLVFFVFLTLSNIGFHLSFFFFIVYVVELYFIILSVSLIVAALYVKFRDLSHIWEVLLQVGFWLTPIIYPLSMIPADYHRFIYLNPLARIIEYSRVVFIDGYIPAINLNVVLLLVTVLFFALSLLIFRKFEPQIAENI